MIYAGKGSFDMIAKIAHSLAGQTKLWAREENITILRPTDVNEVKGVMEDIVWFDREKMRKLLPCIRFGLRPGRTLRETLESNDEYGIPPVPSSIHAAITTLIR